MNFIDNYMNSIIARVFSYESVEFWYKNKTKQNALSGDFYEILIVKFSKLYCNQNYFSIISFIMD